MRQLFSYTIPQTSAGYSFSVRRTPVRYSFSHAGADLRGRVSYRFRVLRGSYTFSYPEPDGRGRYRLRCEFFGDILREVPPPAFMMPVHEALYEKLYTALMPPVREALRSILTRYPGLLPRTYEALNTGSGIQAQAHDFLSADNPEVCYQAAAQHTHSAAFDATDYALRRNLQQAMTAAAVLLSQLDPKQAEPYGAAEPLEFYDNRAILHDGAGGEKLESVVPEAFVTGTEDLLEPPGLREGGFYAKQTLLEGGDVKDAAAKPTAAVLSPNRQTEAEYDAHGGELERTAEQSLAVAAVLHLLCREVFMQGVTEAEAYGACLRILDAMCDMTETGFVRTVKDALTEELTAQLDKLMHKYFTVAREHAARPVPHKSVSVEALLKALGKYEKTGAVQVSNHELSKEPERTAMCGRVARYLSRFTEYNTHTDELICMAMREYMQTAQGTAPELTAGKQRQNKILPENTVLLTTTRLKSALKSAEKLLTAARTGLLDLEDERELTLWSRLWFIRGEGETDRIILPAHDYDYHENPLTFEGFDDLIPENYSVVYPETLRRGVLEHPISKGAELAKREIPVAISVMTELISVLILMWSRFYRAFWGWTGVQAVLGLTCEAYAWLTLESSRVKQDECGSREHYDRCYRWLRWEAEKVAIAARNDMELRGNYYVGLLIEELIGYMTDHHFDILPVFKDVCKMDEWRGLFGREAESDLVWTLDKVKGIRHKIITNKIKGRENV